MDIYIDVLIYKIECEIKYVIYKLALPLRTRLLARKQSPRHFTSGLGLPLAIFWKPIGSESLVVIQVNFGKTVLFYLVGTFNRVWEAYLTGIIFITFLHLNLISLTKYDIYSSPNWLVSPLPLGVRNVQLWP